MICHTEAVPVGSGELGLLIFVVGGTGGCGAHMGARVKERPAKTMPASWAEVP